MPEPRWINLFHLLWNLTNSVWVYWFAFKLRDSFLWHNLIIIRREVIVFLHYFRFNSRCLWFSFLNFSHNFRLVWLVIRWNWFLRDFWITIGLFLRLRLFLNLWCILILYLHLLEILIYLDWIILWQLHGDILWVFKWVNLMEIMDWVSGLRVIWIHIECLLFIKPWLLANGFLLLWALSTEAILSYLTPHLLWFHITWRWQLVSCYFSLIFLWSLWFLWTLGSLASGELWSLTWFLWVTLGEPIDRLCLTLILLNWLHLLRSAFCYSALTLWAFWGFTLTFTWFTRWGWFMNTLNLWLSLFFIFLESSTLRYLR